MSVDPEKLEEWKKKYGEVIDAKLKGGQQVVLRPPDQPDWEEVQDAMNASKPSATKLRQMVLNCTLYPSREEMESYLGRYPATCNALSPHLGELAGNDIEISIKKG